MFLGCVSSSKTNGKNTVLIIGVCVGVVAGIILIIAVTFLLKYCKQDKQYVIIYKADNLIFKDIFYVLTKQNV